MAKPAAKSKKAAATTALIGNNTPAALNFVTPDFTANALKARLRNSIEIKPTAAPATKTG